MESSEQPQPVVRRDEGPPLRAFGALLVAAVCAVAIWIAVDSRGFGIFNAPEPPGAGLTFRNYATERSVQSGKDVLIVRGMIANFTDGQKQIPLLKLTRKDSSDSMLQEKVFDPPVGNLEAFGTVAFRVSLEQPNPEAVRFELTFSASEGK